MNTFDEKYKNLIQQTLQGTIKPTRSGIDAAMYCGGMIEHEMNNGFPLSTLRKIPFGLIASELEFFLKGETDKRWLQKRKNHIYDHWCSPQKVPYSNDSQSLKKMREETDLGPINGFQWRNFNGTYNQNQKSNDGVDQIRKLVHTLKTNPNSKRMIVSAWNPVQINDMAIPPCPFAFGVSVFENKLNLFFFQRSVDLMLGFPFDIAHHALLLHLLAKETEYKEGKLVAFFGNMEIYQTHVQSAQKLLKRNFYSLPEIKTSERSLFKWEYQDTSLLNYKSGKPIKMKVAV